MTPSWPDDAGGPVAVVAAHPDDEALWLSAALAAAARVVFCYGGRPDRPKMAAARRRAVADLPLSDVVDLALPESGARLFVDWARPRLTPAGIEIIDPAARERYEAGYARLVVELRRALVGMGAVYTHNPWGEYGHPDHIQVYRAVAALQAELGYTIWFSNYVGSASWPLACALSVEPCWTQRRTVAPDRVLARRLMGLYRRHGVWTWTLAHRWPAEETVYAQPPAGDMTPRHPLSGEDLLDVAGLRWWPPPWRSVHRRLA